MKELRQAVQAETLANGTSRLTLSIALPGGPYYGQYFLLDQLAQYGEQRWFFFFFFSHEKRNVNLLN